MGVQGLWTLLEPCGKRVNVEKLSNRKVAVDASIWLIQFMKAMRDEKGEQLRNAHVLGFFRRICKLLYHKIRPVFVFDGATPALKRATTAARRRRREQQGVRLKKTAEKLLLSQLKKHALQRAMGAAEAPGEAVPSAPAEEPPPQEPAAAEADPRPPRPSPRRQRKEGFEEEVVEVLSDGGDEEEDDGEFLLPDDLNTVDPTVLSTLPPSIQLEVMEKMREQKTSENREKFHRASAAPSNFSELQLQTYLQGCSFRKQMDGIKDAMNAAHDAGKGKGKRIASEGTREYILAQIPVDPAERGASSMIMAGSSEAGPSSLFRRGEGDEGGMAAEQERKAKQEAGDGGELSIKLEVGGDNDQSEDDSLFGSESGEEGSDEVEWEAVEDEGAAARAAAKAAAPVHWRQRAAERQRFWSRTHGFQMGRKLGDWSEDKGAEASASPKGPSGKDIEEFELARAIEMSRAEAGPSAVAAAEEKNDEDLARAIELSRRETAMAAAGREDDSDSDDLLFEDSVEGEPSAARGATEASGSGVADPPQPSTAQIPGPMTKDGGPGNGAVIVSLDQDEVLGEAEGGATPVEAQRRLVLNSDVEVVASPKEDDLVVVETHEAEAEPQSSGLPVGGAGLSECAGNGGGEMAVEVSAGEDGAAAPVVDLVGSDAEEPDPGPGKVPEAATTEPDAPVDLIGGGAEAVLEEEAAGTSGEAGPLPGGSEEMPPPPPRPPAMDREGIQREINSLDEDIDALTEEYKRSIRYSDEPTSEMYAECQELLTIFGIPYIIAPMEAEAQCAYLDKEGLVHGVVTDDSDAFLFGATNVYRNIFESKKYVEEYRMSDIDRELALSRENLIELALLLGSDYTEGVYGVGIVNAIEIVNEFPGVEGLRRFKGWVEAMDKFGGKGGEGDTDFQRRHARVRKNWDVPRDFPNEKVMQEYRQPKIDLSKDSFRWGKPDLPHLLAFCAAKFCWPREKTEELLKPVLAAYEAQEMQLRLESFFGFSEKFAKFRSARIEKAVSKLKKTKRLMAGEDEDGGAPGREEEPSTKRPRKAPKKGKQRGRKASQKKS